MTTPANASDDRDRLLAELSRLRRKNRALEADIEHMADVVARSAELFVELEESRASEASLRQSDIELRLNAQIDQILQSSWTEQALLNGVLARLTSFKELELRPYALALVRRDSGALARALTRGEVPEWFCKRAEARVLEDATAAGKNDGSEAVGDALVVLPIRAYGRVLGYLCLEAMARESKSWRERWRGAFSTLGALVGASLDRVRAEQRLRRMNRDLELARGQALRANQAKDAFLANMSHELRTPLNIIIGYSELIREDDGDEPIREYHRDLDSIVVASKQLLDLISQLLALTQLKAGELEPVIEPVALAPLVHQVTELVRPTLAKRDNTLTVNVAADAPAKLQTDSNKLGQILFNILGNANKFTERGAITLEVDGALRDGREHVVFAIRDTGIGMTREQLARVFQPFVQADVSPTRRYQGSGIGLTTSRSLAQALGGAIEVESEPGVGSLFRVLIPREPAPPEGTG